MWKSAGFMLLTAAILAGNVIGLSAFGTEEGLTGVGDPPDGLLVGYTPILEKDRTGEHYEYFGWVGAPFTRVVIDYNYYLCCKKTNREMDGCMGLKICATR